MSDNMTGLAAPEGDEVERVARAIRLGRFERNGMGKAYDPDVPLHETEMADARAALSVRTPSVPDGSVMVPIEPTREMRDAALRELSGPADFDPKVAAWDAVRAYRAMIAAAPSITGLSSVGGGA